MEFVLSSEYAATSYGLPVLLVEGNPYGPFDLLPDGRLAAEALITDLNLWLGSAGVHLEIAEGGK